MSCNRSGIGQAWLSVQLHLRGYWAFRQFSQAARNPYKTQHALLRKILATHAQTAFGRQYAFAAINTYEEFAANIPIQTYEDLRPYIEQQLERAVPTHTREMPLFYTQTSGTTGKPKRIPILQDTVTAYRRGQCISAYAQFHGVPGIFSGKILAIVSPAIEGYLHDGTPYGSMSGVVHSSLPAALRSRYVVPQEVFEVDDYETKYRLIAALAVAEEHISVQASANPSTFIRLQEVIDQQAEEIIEFVRTGKLAALPLESLDEDTAKWLPQIPANPERAAHLQRVFASKGTLTYSDLWPNLKALVTWTGGNCAAVLPALRHLLPPATPIVEMGYLSSEFRGTITVDCNENLGAPTIDEVFFEFIEKDDWQAGIKTPRTIEHLEPGKTYYLLATTQNGLYRYFINDLIEVTGYFYNTPTIRFVQKGSGVTSLSGEKLYESQVIEAVSTSCQHLSIMPRFYLLLASRDDFSYTLLFDAAETFSQEALTNAVNQSLFELNQEFCDKVKSGRIRNVSVKRIRPGVYEAYKNHLVKGGRREGQFKMNRLQYRDESTFPFEDYLV